MTETLVRAGMTPAERCRYVADLIQAHPEHFDMDAWFHSDADGLAARIVDGERPDIAAGCGTTCCIAGWAIAVTPADETPDGLVLLTESNFVNGSAINVGAKLLNLDREDARTLFLWDDDEMEELDPDGAAFLLRWHADELDRA